MGRFLVGNTNNMGISPLRRVLFLYWVAFLPCSLYHHRVSSCHVPPASFTVLKVYSLQVTGLTEYDYTEYALMSASPWPACHLGDLSCA